MMNAIDINRWIYGRLSSDEALKAIVGEQVYPIIVEVDGKFPFLVFTRRSATFPYGKDGCYGDSCRVMFTAVARDYSTTCDILGRVREMFETDTEVERARVTGLDEGYYNNCYVQRMTIEFDL